MTSQRQNSKTAEAAADHSAVPLCVDLDGTLIQSDLLIESLLALFSQNPLMVFAMLAWLLRGKAFLKQEVARRVKLDTTRFPYNASLLHWIEEQHGSRKVVLCTASDVQLADAVATHLNIFDEVVASNGQLNLSGARKADELTKRFGDRGFDYVGNARIDLLVWKHSRFAIVVETGSSLSLAAAKHAPVERRFVVPRAGFRTWLKALRIHQWVKNILVFLPLLASHRLFEPDALALSTLSFFCFGMCASSVYLTNDLLDLTSDRQHPSKRRRPFAAGALPLVAGPIAAVALLAVSMGLAYFVSAVFMVVLVGYYVLTTAYSLRLKRMVMLDVIVLATLYTSRILGGTAAIQSKPSFWLLAFSMFIFLSLAMIKRYTELLALQRERKVKISGRGYDVDDIPLIQSLGGSSGYLAVLVLALYVDSTASVSLYRHPHYLWMLCPILLYWISRIWAIAHRGIMHDDPVIFAVTDKVSRVVLLIAAAIVIAAI